MAVSQKTIDNLEIRLDDFNQQIRRESLEALNELTFKGEISFKPEKDVANLHCHSFFSYNGYGYSPSHLAWLGKKNGLKFMGIVDFDVLDGVDEFLDACAYLEIRGSAGIETRVYIPEFAQIEINSPAEPGVCYIMGIGFTSSNSPESVHRILEDIRLSAANRNYLILKQLNEFLDPLKIDYDQDIIPMTPSGNVTERHIVAILADKACNDIENPAQFWSSKLDMPLEDIQKEIADSEGFQNIIRKKLIKLGGVGYIQPTADTFPLIDEFSKVLSACQAIPCAAWLDGSTPGEQAIEKLLDVLIDKGTAAINIIPDRNWNLKEPIDKDLKLKNLYHIVQVASELDLPLMVGTEMNSFGQKIVDDFDIPELIPIKNEFIKGAYFIFGHTQMQRYWGMGYQSSWADNYFKDRKTKNDFYTAFGRLISPSRIFGGQFEINAAMAPEEILDYLNLTKE